LLKRLLLYALLLLAFSPAAYFIQLYKVIAAMYVRVSILAASGASCTKPIPNGWLFVQGKDSSHDDLGHINVDQYDWVKMTAECGKNTSCLAINSNGYMKKRLKSPSLWSTWTEDACLGILVKQGGQTQSARWQ
jgi:hypothetical protein